MLASGLNAQGRILVLNYQQVQQHVQMNARERMLAFHHTDFVSLEPINHGSYDAR